MIHAFALVESKSWEKLDVKNYQNLLFISDTYKKVKTYLLIILKNARLVQPYQNFYSST